MRYCPTCDAEYLEGIETCSDDGTRLLAYGEWEAALAAEGREPKPHLLLSVAVATSAFEADEIAQALADAGCHPSVVSTKANTVDPLTVPGPTTWSVVVP